MIPINESQQAPFQLGECMSRYQFENIFSNVHCIDIGL